MQYGIFRYINATAKEFCALKVFSPFTSMQPIDSGLFYGIHFLGGGGYGKGIRTHTTHPTEQTNRSLNECQPFRPFDDKLSDRF